MVSSLFAPDRGLAIAEGIVQGINGGIQAFTGMQRQREQMDMARAQQASEMELRRMQMQKLQQEISPQMIDFAKIAAAKRAMEAGYGNEKMVHDAMGTALKNVQTPTQAQALNSFTQRLAPIKPSASGDGTFTAADYNAGAGLPAQPQPTEQPQSYGSGGVQLNHGEMELLKTSMATDTKTAGLQLDAMRTQIALQDSIRKGDIAKAELYLKQQQAEIDRLTKLLGLQQKGEELKLGKDKAAEDKRHNQVVEGNTAQGQVFTNERALDQNIKDTIRGHDTAINNSKRGLEGNAIDNLIDSEGRKRRVDVVAGDIIAKYAYIKSTPAAQKLYPGYMAEGQGQLDALYGAIGQKAPRLKDKLKEYETSASEGDSVQITAPGKTAVGKGAMPKSVPQVTPDQAKSVYNELLKNPGFKTVKVGDALLKNGIWWVRTEDGLAVHPTKNGSGAAFQPSRSPQSVPYSGFGLGGNAPYGTEE